MSQSAADRGRSRSPPRARPRGASAETLGEIASERDTALCPATATLGEVCAEIVASGRTAVVALGADGEVCGVVTENDMLAALLEDTPPALSLDSWLKGPKARFPKSQLSYFTLRPDAALVEAAEIMSLEAAKDSGFACHHVLVCDGVCKPRLISALDVARCMLRAPDGSEEAAAVHLKVKHAMKHADDLATCAYTDKLVDAYRAMYALNENSALVLGCAGELSETSSTKQRFKGSDLQGIITAVDSLKTYSERLGRDETMVASWLSLLKASEHCPIKQRSISAEATLADAASVMVASGIHHLVALSDDGNEVVGSVSALDIVRALGSHLVDGRSRQTIGDIVAERCTAVCSHTRTVGDACDILVSSGRTAVVVRGVSGDVCGVLTENDVVAALIEDTSHDCVVDTWLRGARARFPKALVNSRTLRPEASLVDAAEIMCSARDSGLACHHVLVSDGIHEPRLLSALDIARGLVFAYQHTEAGAAACMQVQEAMKPRASVATCRCSDKLLDAYRVMHDANQNAVIVVGHVGEPSADSSADESRVHGIITAADSLRTFSEYQHGDEATVATWLRAFAPGEHASAHQRSIRADDSLGYAARVMVGNTIHHLIVLGDDGSDVVGTLSALDIVCALGSHSALSKPASSSSRPNLRECLADPLSSRSRSPRRAHFVKRHTVGDAVASRATAICPSSRTLGDACDIVVSSGRTASLVVDSSGELCGILTENDILAAMMEDTPPSLTIDAWLRDEEKARVPKAMLHSFTLSPKASLGEASEFMAKEAARDSGLACHHVLVTDGVREPRLLSALDLAHGMMRAFDSSARVGAASMNVKQAMKRREAAATCGCGAKLVDAYRVMYSSGQNCVLVFDENDPDEVLGLVTSADALRSFSELQHGDEVSVAAWLRALAGGAEPDGRMMRSISEDANLAHATRVMIGSGIHHLVVLGAEQGRVVGVLSALDIVRAMGSYAVFGKSEVGATGDT